MWSEFILEILCIVTCKCVWEKSYILKIKVFCCLLVSRVSLLVLTTHIPNWGIHCTSSTVKCVFVSFKWAGIYFLTSRQWVWTFLSSAAVCVGLLPLTQCAVVTLQILRGTNQRVQITFWNRPSVCRHILCSHLFHLLHFRASPASVKMVQLRAAHGSIVTLIGSFTLSVNPCLVEFP